MFERTTHAGAKELGQRGGKATAKRGRDYYVNIGRKGGNKAKEAGMNYSLMGRLGAEAKKRKRLLEEATKQGESK